MNADVRYALDVAKEITISKVSNSSVSANEAGGELVANFYETIFKKVLELTKTSEK